MKLKKPELKRPAMKKPAVKPPDFLTDLYYDLRDRRLLLPIALVIVAIAAVPFLLGDPEPVEPPPAVDAGGGGRGTASANFTVVEAQPGLRDYRKRLGRRTETNPFKQRYTSLPQAARLESTVSSVSSGGESGEVTVTEGEVTEEKAPPSSGGGTGGGGSGGAPSGGGSDGGATARPFELVIDVQISRTETTADGKEKTGGVDVRKNVPVLTQLPGKKTPVVTTMGANFSKERLLFLVSHEVKAISGDYACITRGEICELLEVEPGMLLEYVYEPSGARYAIKVTGVDAIPAREGRAARSSRAALGSSQPDVAFDGHSFIK
jgi:hypothetical protein